MLEEIYHVATGAGLAFASSDTDQSIMADNIASLGSAAHCTVVCDDVSFFQEPAFQDGPIAQAANTFSHGGGLYFSAAGNDGPGVLATYVAVTDPNERSPYRRHPDHRGGFPQLGHWRPDPGHAAHLHRLWRAALHRPAVEPTVPELRAGRWSSQVDFDIYLYDSTGTLGKGHIVAGRLDRPPGHRSGSSDRGPGGGDSIPEH